MTMIGDKSIINEMRLVLTPVLDDELFPRSIQQLREECAPKNSVVGVTKCKTLIGYSLIASFLDEGLLFRKFELFIIRIYF